LLSIALFDSVPKGTVLHSCGIGLIESNHGGVIPQQKLFKQLPVAKATSSGATITDYKLAMAADGEFTTQHGGSRTVAYNIIVAYVNRINAIYRNELSVKFTLVSDSNLIYTNAATDPYTNSNQVAMLGENQTNLNSVIGNANYDIGHVWGYEGSSGGGIASFQSLCNNSFKGEGVSGEGDTTQFAQVFQDQLVLHEMGHQCGMSHSYNSSIPVCTTRNPATSAEPGSGATIMSYGFTCNDATGNDDYLNYFAPMTGPILQFHAVNYSQAISYMASISGGTTVSTGNTPPVVTMPAAFTIPKSTPFYLTGSATDINADALTYCWEGVDPGAITPTATTLANTAQPPFFRSYLPASSSTRIYPLLDSILTGANYAKGDKLPSVSIATKHRLTVRDNNAAGGGVSFDSVTVTVNGSIGPFLVTSNLSSTYSGGSSQTVTWSVNGTSTATANVKISLSADGGYTFPFILAASTPNDGTEAVTLPNVSTTLARIKVEAVGNIFFDISNSNFTITTPLSIKLLSFDAHVQGKNDALLNWNATEEKDLANYNVEMEQGNEIFREMGVVVPKSNSGKVNEYEFIVPSLAEGKYQFRLKLINQNGEISYSAIQTLTIGNMDGKITLYPNPVGSELTISLPDYLIHANLTLINNLGQKVAENNDDLSLRRIQLNNLNSGAYLLLIKNEGAVLFTKQIIKL